MGKLVSDPSNVSDKRGIQAALKMLPQHFKNGFEHTLHNLHDIPTRNLVVIWYPQLLPPFPPKPQLHTTKPQYFTTIMAALIDSHKQKIVSMSQPPWHPPTTPIYPTLLFGPPPTHMINTGIKTWDRPGSECMD